jgi:2,4-didehydro-3-deoxy-L-rhamnonate hydrolase
LRWHGLGTYKAENGKKLALVLEGQETHRLFDLVELFQVATGATAVPTWTQHGLSAVVSWVEANASLIELADVASDLEVAGSIREIPHGIQKLVEPFRPPRIFACASNYREHAKEMGTVLAEKAESKPYMFIKASSAVIGPWQTVVIPRETEKPDWEVELGVVIGKSARRISVDEALDYIAGYTVVNDVSARDLTRRSDYPFKFDWFQGKSFDTFAPVGPWIVPSSVITDPHSLKLQLSVNDDLMQDGTTEELIFNIAEQISYLSDILTLEPGDLIATGTPTGVGASRGIFLKSGDVMRASVQNIGVLENPVGDEA